MAPLFAALGDRTRTQMVTLLAQRDHTVSELAGQFPISLPGAMKHLGVLERAGLVSRTKAGRTVTISLQRPRLESAEVWLHRHRVFWTDHLARLASHVEEQS